jgi:hypothetical protein
MSILTSFFQRALGFSRSPDTEAVQKAILTYLDGHKGHAVVGDIASHLYPTIALDQMIPQVLQGAQILANKSYLQAFQGSKQIDPVYGDGQTRLAKAIQKR